MKVGITNNQYPEQRNILVNPEHQYINLKKSNLFYFINPLRTRLLKKNKTFVFQPVPFSGAARADILHLFNEVAITRQKWVASFETELPRVLPVAGVAKQDNPELQRLIPYLLKDNCLGLIAISDATLNIQMKLFKADVARQIQRKTVVLHPPQTLFVQQKAPRQSGTLRLIFAGNEFYRKGGAEVVLAISELIEEKRLDASQLDVQLIGDLAKRRNVAHRQFQDDEAFYRDIENRIKRHRCFTHHTQMENSALMQLFRQSDAGLLPTWQETYGFSVLEMQANGCPVITSNVRALPEINPDSAGWVLASPLNADREYSITSTEQKTQLRQSLVEGLKSTLLAIIERPEMLQEKGEAAILRIKEQHDTGRYIARLNDIYRRGVVNAT
ncbi:glycosyltransferase family 4 protein [Pantoea eucalypti]|uniref:glycosyltransferase family 4 protein n=1 Tax=Pantoea TaxID=53335 RepID=UPI000CF5466D|nr:MULTISPECIES: glycosyltransferase family 4 protein [Pantoea]MCD2355801.1 glycosyltransferase family 4 protein [Pantoea sp. MHSD4]PQL30023.1 glycosyl transferase [Pantoea ananatis]